MPDQDRNRMSDEDAAGKAQSSIGTPPVLDFGGEDPPVLNFDEDDRSHRRRGRSRESQKRQDMPVVLPGTASHPETDEEVDDVWEAAHKTISREIDAIYAAYAGRKPLPLHHYDQNRRQFTTCCPVCADIHFRDECLYDVTDLVLYYMKKSRNKEVYRGIIDALYENNIGGINFTVNELLKTSCGNGKFRFMLTCSDVVKALCRTVLYMDAASLTPVKPYDGKTLRKVFEKACGRNVLQHYPSIFFLTHRTVYLGDGTSDSVQNKSVELDNIESALRILLVENDPNKEICSVGFDAALNVYDERADANAMPDMLVLRCRKCGMPVAMSAGMSDEVIVGMLGLTSAGKSSIIYAINYLVESQYTTTRIVGNDGNESSFSLSFSINELDVGSGPLREDREWFAKGKKIKKTDKGERFHSTIVVTLRKNNVIQKTINLVLIDIAGEITQGDKPHPIFYQANCFWFCLLPSQNGIDDGTERTDTENPHRRIMFYDSIFEQLNRDRGERLFPVAVIYTRSDCYPKDGDYSEFICHQGVGNITDMRNYLVADETAAGVRVAGLRDLSINVLRFMAEVRDPENRNYLAGIADITTNENRQIVSGTLGIRGNDQLSYFDSRCRYGVFACSPYGKEPIDARITRLKDAHTEAENLQQQADEERERIIREWSRAQTDVSTARRQWEEATKAVENARNDLLGKNNDIDAGMSRVREAEREEADRQRILRQAESRLRTLESEKEKAEDAYQKARKAEMESFTRLDEMETSLRNESAEEGKPRPFGVLLPMLWTLSLEGNLLSPILIKDAVPYHVSDDWLAINREGESPVQQEAAPPDSFWGKFKKIFK